MRRRKEERRNKNTKKKVKQNLSPLFVEIYIDMDDYLQVLTNKFLYFIIFFLWLK